MTRPDSGRNFQGFPVLFEKRGDLFLGNLHQRIDTQCDVFLLLDACGDTIAESFLVRDTRRFHRTLDGVPGFEFPDETLETFLDLRIRHGKLQGVVGDFHAHHLVVDEIAESRVGDEFPIAG